MLCFVEPGGRIIRICRSRTLAFMGLFEVTWDFPSVEPPEYLLRLNPTLYQQEKARMTARFEEAVRLAEQAFVSELATLVEHLVERLSPGVDGQSKVFRDTAIGNLTEFFTRFKSLSVGSNADLDKLVDTARRAISGVDPQAVRDNSGLRQQVAAQLSAVSATLDQMLVDLRAVDVYQEDIAKETRDPQVVEDAASLRVLRGGSWFNGPAYCRSATRDSFAPDYRSDNIGFRVCMDSP